MIEAWEFGRPLLSTTQMDVGVPTTQRRGGKQGVAPPVDEVLWRFVRPMETIRSPLA